MMLLHQVVNECLIGLLSLRFRSCLPNWKGFVRLFSPWDPLVPRIIPITKDTRAFLLQLKVVNTLLSSYRQERIFDMNGSILGLHIMLQH